MAAATLLLSIPQMDLESTSITVSHRKPSPLRRRILLFSFVSLFLLLATISFAHSIIFVEEGHVGVFYRGGALLRETADPGYGVMFPFLTRSVSVPISNQKQILRNVSCNTENGIRGHFDRIEVFYSLRKESVLTVIREYTIDYSTLLILSPLEHLINEFCSKHTLREIYTDRFRGMADEIQKEMQEGLARGVEVSAVRIPKPRIPEEIAAQYEKVELHKAEILVAKERHKMEEEEAEADKTKAVIEFQKQTEIKQESDKLTATRIQHFINLLAYAAQCVWKAFIGKKLPAL